MTKHDELAQRARELARQVQREYGSALACDVVDFLREIAPLLDVRGEPVATIIEIYNSGGIQCVLNPLRGVDVRPGDKLYATPGVQQAPDDVQPGYGYANINRKIAGAPDVQITGESAVSLGQTTGMPVEHIG